MDAIIKHLHSESTNMSDKRTDTNSVMSGRVHRLDNAAANEHMPRSVWQPGVVQRLADYIKQLREVDKQSDERAVSNQPDQPGQPEFSGHVCTRNPNRTCNCPTGSCADDDSTYRYARGPFGAVPIDEFGRVITPKPNELGNFRCPVNNLACSVDVCSGFCLEGGSIGAKT